MTQSSKPWTDKVAVITGGASGIGEAAAIEFVSRGAKIVILDRAKTPPHALSTPAQKWFDISVIPVALRSPVEKLTVSASIAAVLAP